MAGLEIRDTRKLPNEVPFSDLVEFTDNFSYERIIGGTTVGFVWKGLLRDGRVISVKKLHEHISPLARDKEFRNKVQEHIMSLKHENIVAMVAFCREEKEMVAFCGEEKECLGVELVESLLCYEYLPKGSLDQYIFAKPNVIDWDTRFKIIEGICHGLHYLHTRDVPVLHMDLKPKTILLDDNMSPKIADFGLARIFRKDKTTVLEHSVVGTYGYLAPEYIHEGEISTRSDIYSLGILILEITTGEQNHIDKTDGPAMKYIEKIRQEWTKDHITSTYSKLRADRFQEVEVCIRVGLDCVEIEHRKRPSIGTIVETFSGRRVLQTDSQTRRKRKPTERKPTETDKRYNTRRGRA